MTVPDPDAPTLAVADPTWLALREEADRMARDAGAADLLRDLVADLGADLPGGHAEPLQVVDLGAGTGSNHRYLAARLPFPQQWVAVDHDPSLLSSGAHGAARRIVADVADLGAVLRGLGSSVPRRRLLTCSALLDVLTHDQLDELAAVILESGAPALLSLSVTGRVGWDPGAPEDAELGAAFDAHQQRDGRAGPAAAGTLAGMLRRGGRVVRAAATPWRLAPAASPPDSGERRLVDRWLDERVQAALEQEPALRSRIDEWRQRRRSQLASGRLSVQVDHLDLLVTGRGEPADRAR